MSDPARRRCCICRKLTTKWQRANGGPWYCYDGCYETTGRDRRTWDAKPAWESVVFMGKKCKPFDDRRMNPSQPR